MAATSITVYADDLQDFVNSGIQQPAGIGGGRVHVASFRWTAASEASGTSIAVAVLPKGARIISGVLAASASFSTTQIAVGLAAKDGLGNIDDATSLEYRADGTVASYKPDGSAVTAGSAVSDSTTCLKAAATQSTTQIGFALTTALGYGYKLAKECYLTLTTSVATAGTDYIIGHVTYTIG